MDIPTPVPFAVPSITKSPYYNQPEKFCSLGQRVRAKIRVYDCPGEEDQGPIHAEPGDLGTVVHVEEGFWPTVRFDRTGTATCVTDEEVVKVLPA